MRATTYILLGGLGAAFALFAFSRTRTGAAAASSSFDVLFTAARTVTDALGVTSRGLRDNNPGNIRRSSENWIGELTRADVEQAGMTWDAEFEQFSDVRYGVRALGRLLLTYNSKYGLNTVRGIVSRYAPPAENDTESYIADVAGALGVSDSERIDVYARLPDIAEAMMIRETGYRGDIQQITTWVYS